MLIEYGAFDVAGRYGETFGVARRYAELRKKMFIAAKRSVFAKRSVPLRLLSPASSRFLKNKYGRRPEAYDVAGRYAEHAEPPSVFKIKF